MKIDVVTIFPTMFVDVFDFGILGRARERELIDVRVHDLRDWTKDKHRSTDDAPYGGGPGMVMKVEPLVDAIETLNRSGTARVILLSARGTPLRQERVQDLSTSEHLILVAGRYEGVDERFIDETGAEEVSIGDYVLSGGEIPVMVLVDAVARLLPGAMSDPRSAAEDSFSCGILDYPHYTRPAEFRGRRVPDVLLSGDHAAVDRWRATKAKADTEARRPELLDGAKSPPKSTSSNTTRTDKEIMNECHR